jgi:isoquinoline 1-oxidoreductase beta subunit
MSGTTSGEAAGGRGLTRRQFLKSVSVGGAALVIAVQWPRGLLAAGGEAAAAAGAAAPEFAPGAFLRIDAGGAVTVTVARSELGQGARTVVPMLVAEELEADWALVRVEPAIAHPERYGPMTTGGSSTVRGGWDPLRKAGAAAREMLRQAAAERWGVALGECRAEKGAVVHGPSGRTLPYGELVGEASRLPVPQDPPLKGRRDWRVIGTSPARLDTPDKVRGAARFGFDQTRPGAPVAVVARCPVFGGKARAWDAAAALAVPGVRAVREISTGVAVIADSTWAALRGREALQPAWDEGPHARLSTEDIRAQLAAKAAAGGVEARHDGDVAGALARAARRLEADYEVPFLAHAPLEPMNCLADVRADAAEVWAPTQAPQWAQQAVAGVSGLPLDKVAVHTTLSGGGFGRRLMDDFVAEAAELSRAIGGPVKVVWTREDDMTHDYYRPPSLHRLTAGLDAAGKLTAWRHLIVAPSIMGQNFPESPAEEVMDAVDGAAGLPYGIANVQVAYARHDTPVPVGWWRSVYNTQNAFANECFLDEIAAATGADPLALRRSLLPADGRHRAVLERAAAAAGWGTPAPAGRARGLAVHESFGSFCAQVAEVSVARGAVRVHRIVCALDCGVAVHPAQIAVQVEGAVALALSAALHDEITVAGGRVRERNYDGHPMLAFDAMPEVEVHLIAAQERPGGVGEPPVPPVAPAVCNAVFAATGQRVRRLPIRLA